MVKSHSLIYIVGSILIGLIATLLLYITLMLTGVIQYEENHLIIESHSASKEYDGEVLTCHEYSLKEGSKLQNGHELKLVYNTNIVGAGSKDNSFTPYVYDSNGIDITNNYTIDVIFGSLTITKKPLSVKIDNIEKQYDGNPIELTANNYSVISGGLVESERIARAIYSEDYFLDPLKTDISLALEIVDDSGKITTPNYDIYVVEGNVNITKVDLTLKSQSITKTYDGNAVNINEDAYSIIEGQLVKGHHIECEFYNQAKEVGTTQNEFNARILDESGYDVTNVYYNLKLEAGLIEIEPASIELKSNSIEYNYNSELQTYNSFTYTAPKINPNNINRNIEEGIINVFDYIIELVFNEGFDSVGIHENTFSYRILNSSGSDVTDSNSLPFIIDKCEFGKITINPKRINLLKASREDTYNGAVISGLNNEDIIISGLCQGHSINYDFTAVESSFPTDAGVYNFITTYDIFNEYGENITSNYQLYVDDKLANDSFNSKLVINPIKIIIETAGETQDYTKSTSKLLTNHEWKLVSGSVINDDTLRVRVYGALTNVGSCYNNALANVFTYDGDVSPNYEIDIKPGLLLFTTRETANRIVLVPETMSLSKADYSSYEIDPLTGVVSARKTIGGNDTFDINVKIYNEEYGVRKELRASDGYTIEYPQQRVIIRDYNAQGTTRYVISNNVTISKDGVALNKSVEVEEGKIILYSNVIDKISFYNYDGINRINLIEPVSFTGDAQTPAFIDNAFPLVTIDGVTYSSNDELKAAHNITLDFRIKQESAYFTFVANWALSEQYIEYTISDLSGNDITNDYYILSTEAVFEIKPLIYYQINELSISAGSINNGELSTDAVLAYLNSTYGAKSDTDYDNNDLYQVISQDSRYKIVSYTIELISESILLPGEYTYNVILDVEMEGIDGKITGCLTSEEYGVLRITE